MQQLLELHKRRDFSAKLGASIDFIRINAKSLIKASVFICGPFIILGAVIMTQSYTQMITSSMGSSINSSYLENNMVSFMISVFAGSIFFAIAGALLISVTYQYIVIYDNKKTTEIPISEIWARVKYNVWNVLGTFVMIFIPFMIIYLVVIFVMAMLFSASTALGILVGLVLFCAVFYLGIVISLVFIIQAYEKINFLSALGRSFTLIKDYWWSTFAIFFVAGFIQSIVSWAFMIPWYITVFAGAMHMEQGESISDPSLLFQVANYTTLSFAFLGSMILQAFPLIAIAFQYFNLVETKESRGLMGKIETFGETPDNTEDEEHY